MLYEGRPIAEALVLSHETQRDQLAEAVPAAAHTAVVAGDACFDRLLASLPWRPSYRHALGVDDRRLVLISSTWWAESALGRAPDVFTTLLAELPADEYSVAAVLHPNIWYGHGSAEVHRMLAPHERSGLLLVPPEFGWRAALIAADHVVGDHGSVTTYAAALAKPVLLASFPESEVAPGSVVDRVGRTAPRWNPAAPLPPQLAAAEQAAGSLGALGELVTSCPDQAAERVRGLCYRMLNLAEPSTEPPVPPDDLTGLPARPAADRPSAVFAEVTVRPDDALRVRRLPAEMLHPDVVPAGAQLVVAADHPGRRLRAVADVLVLTREWPDVEQWLGDALAARPGLRLAAARIGGSCLVRSADGESALLRAQADELSPACLAAGAAGWIRSGRSLGELSTGTLMNEVPIEVTGTVPEPG